LGVIEWIQEPEPGRPGALLNDGAVDRQGSFWAGQPRTDRPILLPVAHPTSCAFGGANLDHLYTARAWRRFSRPTCRRSVSDQTWCARDA
jgi:sugar lactone lactonase YvrE